jgi:hypothetical protein
MKMLLEYMESRSQSQNRRLQNAMTPDKKPSAVKNFLRNFLDASRMPRLLRQVLQSHR